MGSSHFSPAGRWSHLIKLSESPEATELHDADQHCSQLLFQTAHASISMDTKISSEALIFK